MNRNLSAFTIAFLLHVILLLLILLIERKIDIKKPEPKKEEKRMKVSLKEQPKAKKESLVKNKKEPKKELPMPKGKQLKEVVKKPFIKPTKETLEKKVQPVAQPKKITPKKEPKATKPKSEPIPSKKPLIKVKQEDTKPKKPTMAERLAQFNNKKTEDKNVSKKPEKEHSNLYNLLSQEAPVSRSQKNAKATKKVPRFTQQIKEAYGNDWGKLSRGEQKYILDNQEIMRRLTQTQLYATGSTDIPNNLRVNEINIIEFYLHTNGDMTDFKIVKKSNFFLLDDVTKDVIESVYSKYPRPAQKTLIRYKFWYNLRGY